MFKPGQLIKNIRTKKVYIVDHVRDPNDIDGPAIMARNQLTGVGHGPTFQINPNSYKEA